MKGKVCREVVCTFRVPVDRENIYNYQIRRSLWKKKLFWFIKDNIHIFGSFFFFKHRYTQDIQRSHKTFWDLTRSTEISQDLLRSHKIYWFGKIHLTFDIQTFTFDIWHAITFDIWHFTSHKIYRDFTRSTEISKDLLIWHLTFDI